MDSVLATTTSVPEVPAESALVEPRKPFREMTKKITYSLASMIGIAALFLPLPWGFALLWILAVPVLVAVVALDWALTANYKDYTSPWQPFLMITFGSWALCALIGVGLKWYIVRLILQ